MVFAFLFGLSMDYEVFILSRIREAYDATGDARHAVTEGLGRTGRLVTSAAAILMLSFLSMSTGPQTDLKILATGLGAGHPHRRRRHPLPARPGAGRPVRPGQLVAAVLAGPAAPDPGSGRPGGRTSECTHRPDLVVTAVKNGPAEPGQAVIRLAWLRLRPDVDRLT